MGIFNFVFTNFGLIGRKHFTTRHLTQKSPENTNVSGNLGVILREHRRWIFWDGNGKMVMEGKCENHFENIVLYALIWKWLRWVASYVIYIYICRCIWRRYKWCKEKQQWEFLVVWSYITIFLFSFFCHFRGRIQINLSLENGSTTQMWDFYITLITECNVVRKIGVVSKVETF